MFDVSSLTEELLREVAEERSPGRKLPGDFSHLIEDLHVKRGILPGEIASNCHLIRVSFNKIRHSAEAIPMDHSDAEVCVRCLLKVMRWWFCHARSEERLPSLFLHDASDIENLPQPLRDYLGRLDREFLGLQAAWGHLDLGTTFAPFAEPVRLPAKLIDVTVCSPVGNGVEAATLLFQQLAHSRIVGLAGEPGSGKTTLLKTLCRSVITGRTSEGYEGEHVFFLPVMFSPLAVSRMRRHRSLRDFLEADHGACPTWLCPPADIWQVSKVLWIWDGFGDLRSVQDQFHLFDWILQIQKERPDDRVLISGRQNGMHCLSNEPVAFPAVEFVPVPVESLPALAGLLNGEPPAGIDACLSSWGSFTRNPGRLVLMISLLAGHSTPPRLEEVVKTYFLALRAIHDATFPDAPLQFEDQALLNWAEQAAWGSAVRRASGEPEGADIRAGPPVRTISQRLQESPVGEIACELGLCSSECEGSPNLSLPGLCEELAASYAGKAPVEEQTAEQLARGMPASMVSDAFIMAPPEFRFRLLDAFALEPRTMATRAQLPDLFSSPTCLAPWIELFCDPQVDAHARVLCEWLTRGMRTPTPVSTALCFHLAVRGPRRCGTHAADLLKASWQHLSDQGVAPICDPLTGLQLKAIPSDPAAGVDGCLLVATVPVTNRAYGCFCGDSGDHPKPKYWDDPRFNAPEHPVVGVTWHDMRAFCLWASLRITTEPEWEYVSRKGLPPDWSLQITGDKILEKEAWFGEPRETGTTHPVGLRCPNVWGLHDLFGNVFELCESGESGPSDVPQWAQEAGTERHPVFGGCWHSPPEHCRPGYREWIHAMDWSQSIGFRVAASL